MANNKYAMLRWVLLTRRSVALAAAPAVAAAAAAAAAAIFRHDSVAFPTDWCRKGAMGVGRGIGGATGRLNRLGLSKAFWAIFWLFDESS
jgi:hypothetical protein